MYKPFFLDTKLPRKKQKDGRSGGSEDDMLRAGRMV